MGLLPRDEPTALRLERLRSQLRSSQVPHASELVRQASTPGSRTPARAVPSTLQSRVYLSYAYFLTSQEALDEVRRVEAERGAGAPAVPAVQGALGVFPKTRAVLDTFKGSLDTL